MILASRTVVGLAAAGLAFTLSSCVALPENEVDGPEPESLAQQHAASDQVMMFETSEAQLLASPGTGAYTYDPGSDEVTPVEQFKPAKSEALWYSVASTDMGSWMVEVRPVSEFPEDGSFRDLEPLKATGEVRTIEKSQPAYRASNVVFWVPNSALADHEHEYLSGQVRGEFPSDPPLTEPSPTDSATTDPQPDGSDSAD